MLSLAQSKVIFVEQNFWIGRMNAAVTSAEEATTSESRLEHYELAGRYSVAAARSAPFMLPRKSPATEGEREALRPPRPPRPGSIFRPIPHNDDGPEDGR